MSDVEDLAKHVSSETPWWATAPVWLAAGIVGVPALMAIASGYYIAQNVTASLKQLTTYNLSELHMFNEHLTVSQHNFEVVLKFMDDDLRAQYQACLNSARTNPERLACVSPAEREREYGISPAPVRRQNKSSSAPANP